MAVSAPNKFYIEPSKADITPVLQGIGSMIKESRDAKLKQQNSEALMAAYKGGNPDDVAALIASNPELAGSLNTMLKFKSDKTAKGFNDTVRNIALDPNNAEQILIDRIEMVNAEGGDATQSVMALDQLQRDPEGFNKSLLLMGAGSLDKQSYDALKLKLGGGKDPEFLKEERKNAAQDVRSFNTKAREMRSSYGKLKGLAEQAKGGDRGARNAMVVSLARLISPGIVTETEAAALGGGQNTMQAVIGALSGKGFDTEALLRQIDPYGDSFDSDGLLQVGESVVASSRQPLIDMYEGSRNRAERAGMRSGAFDTNFGKNANYDFLTTFKGAGQAPSGKEDQLSPEDQADLERLEAKFSGR